jgi:DNA-binding GntR family transcriptional regulator
METMMGKDKTEEKAEVKQPFSVRTLALNLAGNVKDAIADRKLTVGEVFDIVRGLSDAFGISNITIVRW